MIVGAGLDPMVCLGIYRVQFSFLSFFPPSSVHNIYDLYVRIRSQIYSIYEVKPRTVRTLQSSDQLVAFLVDRREYQVL